MMESSYSVYTREPQPPAPKANKPFWNARTKRVAKVLGVLLVIIGVTTAAIWAYRSHAKTKLIAEIKTNIDFQKAREAVDSGTISRDEMREVMRGAFEERMDKQLDLYFALPIGPERQAFLDTQIDEMQQRMKERAARAPSQPATRPWGPPPGQAGATSRPARDPAQQIARMRSRMENGTPARQALRAQFIQEMRARMAARGIESGFGGRGGLGGGGGRP